MPVSNRTIDYAILKILRTAISSDDKGLHPIVPNCRGGSNYKF